MLGEHLFCASVRYPKDSDSPEGKEPGYSLGHSPCSNGFFNCGLTDQNSESRKASSGKTWATSGVSGN